MKIVTVIGARPQFIKSVPVSRELKKSSIQEIVVHTGQHYDQNMSEVFFDQMQISKPNYDLNINGMNHGAMTGQMLERIEQILTVEKPDFVIVYGDTNSTLAGALAATKLNIKVVHIEAGLRSYNMKMPEEINRILTDRISSYLFCPTNTAMNNLKREGFNDFDCKIIKSGDVMLDAVFMFSEYATKPKVELPEKFNLCTIHRQENTDDKVNMTSIINALNEISLDQYIILPLHPRTQKKILEYKLNDFFNEKLIVIDPIGYLEMLYLLKKSSIVITDSGGLQKEAFFYHKPCLTLRNETEWIELVTNGFNVICGTKYDAIVANYKKIQNSVPDFNINLYGDGSASKLIVETIFG